MPTPLPWQICGFSNALQLRRSLLQEESGGEDDPAGTRAARNSSSFFALLRDPRVSLILLPHDLSLRAEDNTLEPTLVIRNVTVWGGPQAASRAATLDSGAQPAAPSSPSPPGGPANPVSSSLDSSPSPGAAAPGGQADSGIGGYAVAPVQPTPNSDTLVYVTRLDWGFLAARVKLAPGIQLTMRDVELYRAHTRVSAHLDFMAASPNASLRLERIVQHRVASYSPAKAPPAPSPSPSPSSHPSHSHSPIPSPSPAAAAPSSDELGLNTGTLCFVLQPADPIVGLAVAAVSARARSAAAPPPGVPAGLAVVCRSPYLQLFDIAYTTQYLDSTLANNGGYSVHYTNSAMVCDYPVDPSCIAVRGGERCISDEHAADQALAEAAATGVLPASERSGGGGSSPQTLALGLGLGLGLGVLALALAGIGLLWFTRRRQAHPAGSDPKPAGGLGGLFRHWAAARHAPGPPRGSTDARSSLELSSALEPSGPEGALQGPRAGGLLRAKPEGAGLQVVGMALGHATSSDMEGCDSASATTRALAPASGSGEREGARTLEGVQEHSDSLGKLEPSRVEAVRRQLAASRREVAVQILELLGQGSFARVYKASWQGTIVALKVLVLPASLTNDEQRQQVAVMEAAVSSATSHPNLVQWPGAAEPLHSTAVSIQTYSYSFKAVLDSTRATSRTSRDGGELGSGGGDAGGAEADEVQAHGYELHLVLVGRPGP
ncbi:hypothetical protein HYH03_011707 [Edaphochlamys debaryana]|uniref:Protein kinase domain-containing protein n=1 Tax=Edaphochlamys debaryana TaxID=47281 RepID=A0A835XZS2_9CHLO|nr:hypothetical protein HYH03_011707 [Edaphochlamys debaryana]|eukprot:KAG2489905.1 hypothetical protein HYH03_011707 [Edaphochlamys debaryana]